jgi:5-methylcytosine-specific restriction enzyme A
MPMLVDLRPTSSARLIDLVARAGFDVSDWGNYKRGAAYASQNPKYCYEWSFVEPGRLVLLSLWYQNMSVEGELVVHRRNFRKDAWEMRHNPKWRRSAPKLDLALQHAAQNALPVRVIVNEGLMRDNSDPDAEASQVKLRALDPEPWTVLSYDSATGDHLLVRGSVARLFTDQHLFHSNAIPLPLKERLSSPYVRDRRIRDLALIRAAGSCELCGEVGFRTIDGRIYLETHHVVPLSEGGSDDARNVVALCPNDHRRAHFGDDRESIRAELTKRLAAHEPSPGNSPNPAAAYPYAQRSHDRR